MGQRLRPIVKQILFDKLLGRLLKRGNSVNAGVDLLTNKVPDLRVDRLGQGRLLDDKMINKVEKQKIFEDKCKIF